MFNAKIADGPEKRTDKSLKFTRALFLISLYIQPDFFELRFAARRPKIIRFAFVFGLSGGGGFLDLHSADRIFICSHF